MPYAYPQKISHTFETDHIEISILFKHQMKRSSDPLATPPVYDILPDINKWIIEADAETVAAISQSWTDENTLLVVSDTIANRPQKTTLEFNGPDENLCYRWEKQIEPFGPIESEDKNWYENPSFVDRGDPAADDFTQAVLTLDNAWHDLDLSGIVPEGAKAVVFSFAILASSASRFIRFRKKGNTNENNRSQTSTQVANVSIYGLMITAIDSNRVCQYRASSSGITNISLCVSAWFQ